MTVSSYAERLTLAFRVTEPAIRQAVRSFDPPRGSRGLDAGCGIGQHTILLAEQVGAGGTIVGLDISREHLEVAREAARSQRPTCRVDFVEGDILALPFSGGDFDWVWCADTLYAGALVPDPAPVVAELDRVVRPGGTVALAYWAGQSLLPGYATLEARLNNAFASSVPYVADVAPALQHQRALGWLRAAGLRDVGARSFVADVRSPLDAALREGVDFCISMLWDEWGDAVSGEDRAMLRALLDPASPHCLLDRDDYYGFVVYTLFTATKAVGGAAGAGA